MQVRVAPDANQDRPIPVDVVFVWDADVDAAVAELPARDWFQQKAQFLRDDPEGQTLAVHEWEWVPGQAVPAIDLQVSRSARRPSSSSFATTSGCRDRRQPPPPAEFFLDG
jgi:hypothetical protein